MDTPVKSVREQPEQRAEGRLRLAAFEDDQLCDEAVQQLIAIREDRDRPVHRGRDLPSLSKADLLNQIIEEAE